MALRKEVVTNYGIKADYWRVVRYNVDALHYTVEFEVVPYISQEIREQGYQPLESDKFIITEYGYRPVEIDGVENPSFNAYETYFAADILEAEGITPVQAAYNYLKKHTTLFSDATDC